MDMWSDVRHLDRTVAMAEKSVPFYLYIDYLEYLSVYITVIRRRCDCILSDSGTPTGSSITDIFDPFDMQTRWPFFGQIRSSATKFL